MRKYIVLLIIVLAATPSIAQNPEAPSWLDFTTKRAINDLKNSVLLDYSYAGYHFSEKELPDVSGWKTVSVVDYGAIPNDDVYDDTAIQAAINAAGAANVPTVVFFPAGKYLVSSEQTRFTPIEVNSSNIVLKGAGTGTNGTEIYADKMGDTSLKWNTQWNFIFKPKSSGSIRSDIKKRINRGDTQIEVADGGKFSVGMPVVVNQHNGTENVALNMPGLTMKSEWEKIHETGMRVTEKNVIEAISGNLVTLKRPINCYVTADISKATLEKFNSIEEVGVEDILLTSGWKDYPETFQHHKNNIVDYGWRAIQFDGVRNGWIRNVEFRHWNESLHVNSSLAVTVEDVKFSGKQGHVSSQAGWSTGVLFKNCEDLVPVDGQGRAGQWHGPGLQVRSTGCVYLNFKMQHHQFLDFHGYQPYGNLLDNIHGGILDRNGGSPISQPHSGPDICFWNFEQNSDYVNKTYNFWDLSRRTQSYLAHPKFIGFTSPGENISFKNVGLNELQGTHVYPQSLFDAQLQLRLYGSYMSASSEKSNAKAVNANDDLQDTAWESASTETEQWILLDLGSSQSVSAITVSEDDLVIDNWMLEYWDGNGWKTVETGNEIGESKVIGFNTVNTRKIKLNILSKLPGTQGKSYAINTFKVGGTLAVDDSFKSIDSVRLYPNPNSGKFVLDVPPSHDNVLIEIYNLRGQLVLANSYNFRNGRVDLDIENNPSGVYFVKVHLENPKFIKVVRM
ncbi:MAG: DUF4955 domain-containing protein [Leeuwenhoekiella sp.]